MAFSRARLCGSTALFSIALTATFSVPAFAACTGSSPINCGSGVVTTTIINSTSGQQVNVNDGASLEQSTNGSRAIDLSGANDSVTFSGTGRVQNTGNNSRGTLAIGLRSTGGGLTLQMNDTSEIEMLGS